MIISNKIKSQQIKQYKFFTLMLMIFASILLGIALLPYAKTLLSEEGCHVLITQIQNKGLLGMVFFIGIQILQIVIFIIPGEAVEILAGMLYGTWWGYIVCQIGIMLGTTMIYYLVKNLGKDFITQFIAEKKLHTFNFLHNHKKIEWIVFILFFIPGTPKDVLTYFIPLTSLSLTRFLLISGIARIPAVISSTFVGASMQQGQIGISIIVFVGVGVLALIGLWVNHKFLAYQQRMKR